MLLYIIALSFILNFPLARQNFTIALLSFLFLSATGFKKFPLVSRTSIGYCSSSTACVYFSLIQNTLWNDNEENKNEKIHFDFSHNSTHYLLHYTTKTVYSTFYCHAFAGSPGFAGILETIKSLNDNRCQFTYHARVSLHTIM